MKLSHMVEAVELLGFDNAARTADALT